MYEFRYYENKTHGSPRFPVQIYKVEHTRITQLILPIHWHNEMEIIFLDQGQASFRIEEEVYPIQAGDALIVHPGELHSGFHQQSKEVAYYSIVFKLSWIISHQLQSSAPYESPSLIQQNLRFPTLLTMTDPIHIELLSIIKLILRKHEQRRAGYELGLKGLLCLLFSAMYEYDLLETGVRSTNHRRSEAQTSIKRVIDYMEARSSENLSLDEMAAHISLSRSHFCRFFKTQTGMRPFEYLNYIRVNNAANMLRSGNRTVLEAAVEAGFHTPSYFTKCFKQIYHLTPSQYKTLYSSGI